MATLAPKLDDTQDSPTFTHWNDGRPEEGALDHIPGESGWPIVGNTFTMLAEPHAFANRMIDSPGKVYKS